MLVKTACENPSILINFHYKEISEDCSDELVMEQNVEMFPFQYNLFLYHSKTAYNVKNQTRTLQ